MKAAVVYDDVRMKCYSDGGTKQEECSCLCPKYFLRNNFSAGE